MEKQKYINHNKISVRDALKHIGAKRVAAMVISIIVAASIIIAISVPFYQSKKESIELYGEYSTSQIAVRLDRHLVTGKNSLMLCSSVVDKMIRLGASSEELYTALQEETDRLRVSMENDFKGLYGWLDGNYITTTGFVPDSTYNSKQRPWYIKARKAKGELVYVDPYEDANTGDRIMTIAKLLGDGESVIALDVPLDTMQQIVDDAAVELENGDAMVLGKDGDVVVSSDKSQLGHDYIKEEDTLGSLIAEKIYQNHQDSFSVTFQGETYVVYSIGIDSGWHVVSILNSRFFYSTLRIVILISFTLLLLIIVLLAVVFIRISKRSLMSRNLNIQLSAIADIYNSVVDINLTENSFLEIINHENFAGVQVRNQSMAQESLYAAIEQFVIPSFLPALKELLDLSTLGEKLKDRSNVILEFMDKEHGWCRGRMIVAQRDSEGRAVRVLWTIETIDEEKRSREELIRLAETDQMTGILNRTSGEQKIQELLSLGKGGMFMMLDIDHFKSINDRFGHSVGDKVIIQVADSLRNAFRNGDIVLRLGGDEFAAFAPGVFAQKISERIMTRFFKYLNYTEIPELKGEPIHVSIGVAFCSKDSSMEFQEIYELADQRTYQSKKTEGNQITYE